MSPLAAPVKNRLKEKCLLVVSNGYPSADGLIPSHTFVKHQVDAIKRYFQRVHVVVPTPYFPKALRHLPGLPRPFHNWSLFEDYAYDNVTVNFPKYLTLPLEPLRRLNGEFAFHAARRCVARHRLNFDLIHAHFIWPSGYAGCRLKRCHAKPLVMTVHGFDVHTLPRRGAFWRGIISRTVDQADTLIAVSAANRDLLHELNRKTDRCVLISNGIDPGSFHLRDKDTCRRALSLPLDTKLILSIGNLVPVKNHRTLIRAMGLLLPRRQDSCCLIVGDGPLRDELEGLIDSLGLRNHVRLLGSRPHTSIPKWMAAANLLALPSLHEGFGIVQTEAMACGIPVVASRNGGSEEIIISNDIGLIYEGAQDPQSLAEAIDEALERHWDERMISAHALSHYCDENVTGALITVYRHSLNS